MAGIGDKFDAVKKVVVGAAALLATVIVVVAIVRQAFSGGIVLDPVVVKASDDSLTPDTAAQQISRQLYRVQQAGVDEWRRVHVDDGTHAVDLQIPGSPLSVGGIAREVVALFGLAPRSLRTAIVHSPAGYSAVVSLVGDHGSVSTCPDNGKAADTLDTVYECIARNAIRAVDAKVAASYVFQREQAACGGLDTGAGSDSSSLQREEIRIANRRGKCGFPQTQSLVAQVMSKGLKVDLPWVPYIYGQVHLARAQALRELDIDQRLSEFDQAIGRFLDSLAVLPNSPTTVAVLTETYIAKAIAIHESAPSDWQKYGPLIEARLDAAESTLQQASERLSKISWWHRWRSDALDALVRRQEALLGYRLWMIKAHRRTQSGKLTVSDGTPAEQTLLAGADANYVVAETKRPLSALDYMQWGNILRAMRDFQGAIEKYRLAADLEPTVSDPVLNIAVANLDRAVFAPKLAPPGDLLLALGSVSDYLAWNTEGGPYNQLIPQTRQAIERGGVASEAEAFDACMTTLGDEPAGDGPSEKWRMAAIFKSCVDAAIERVVARMREVKKT